MTPKEKAKELVDRFDEFTIHHSWREKNDDAIECALIAINEILNEYNDFMQTKEQFGYWEEVKQEINGI